MGPVAPLAPQFLTGRTNEYIARCVIAKALFAEQAANAIALLGRLAQVGYVGFHSTLVWNHVKRHRVGRASVSGPDDLKKRVLSAVHSLQKSPTKIRGFFQAPSVRYAAA